MSSLGMLRGLGTNEHWLVTAIIPYLSEEDMAESTARALGGMSLAPDIAVPALRKTLASKNPEVRVWAIVALGHFHSQASSAVPELGRALVDSDPRVRQEAMNALERIKWGTAVTNGAKGF
jgi:HEAT repeat protein